MITVTRRPKAVRRSPRLLAAYDKYVKGKPEFDSAFQFNGRLNGDDTVFLYGDEIFIVDTEVGFFAGPNGNPDVSSEEHIANIENALNDVQDMEKDLDAALERAVDPNNYGAYFNTFEEALEMCKVWHSAEDPRTIPKCYHQPIESEIVPKR